MNHKRICILRLNTTVVPMVLTVLLLLPAMACFAQLSLSSHRVPLEKIIDQLCTRSGYGYFFQGPDIDGNAPADLVVRNASFDQAMKKLLAPHQLSYTLNGKIAMIRSLTSPPWRPSSHKAVNITGFVSDEKKVALADVFVRIKNTSRGIFTSHCGAFTLEQVPTGSVLVISHVGYRTREVQAGAGPVWIPLSPRTDTLEEVGILSNGYQSLPKERATGSFILVDSALLNRKVGTSILDRLDGVTSGLLFNRNTSGNTPAISIRDRGTISASAEPLVVLDNFPYDGGLSNINPGDVTSITILKDAAAASIWGSRAGNGVIVITTRKGSYNQEPLLAFNTNVTLGAAPDPYFRETISNKDYIGIEQLLFDKGKFNSRISSGYAALSPAVEIMLLARKNLITGSRRAAMLDSLAAHDSRAELARYFYRSSINQQYHLSVGGGGAYNKYYLSAGYDRNLPSGTGTSFDRLTVSLNNTTLLCPGRVQLQTGLMLWGNSSLVKGSDYLPQYPYQQLADQNGNALALADGTLRLSYVDTAGNGKLLDWHYRPLDELSQGYHTFRSTLTSYRASLQLSYQVVPGLKASIAYTYDKGLTESAENYSAGSYYTRNLVNTFTRIDPLSGAVTRPVPAGDILTSISDTYRSHYARGQLTYEKESGPHHAIHVLGGYELKNYESFQSALRLYGYDPATATNLNAAVNPAADFPYYYNTSVGTIPLPTGNSRLTDRYLSWFANGSYTYRQRYVLSASARLDQSNIFGVSANQKGVPLWSAGLSWEPGREEFYRFSALPYLRLRATYGYSGNVDKTTSALLTTQTVNGGNDWGQPILLVNNPPNPSLRWEKVKNTNFGIDFGGRKNRFSGSLEYWIKDGIDLIGQSPVAPQTGVSVFKGNSANMRSRGIDLALNTVNLSSADFCWQSTFLWNYNADKITSYKVKQGTNAAVVAANYISPLQGYSYYSIFSYRWMGLDQAGNPQGLLGGQLSRDYAGISSSTNTAELVYSGTSRPVYYGALRNSFRYRSWGLSFNLLYKLHYAFRRPSLNNFALFQGAGYAPSYQQADYALRWQKPGDELITSVPSLIYPASSARDDLYTYSQILVERADHIRLQDLRLDYRLPGGALKVPGLSGVDCYLYGGNLGILWKKTRQKTDPDYPLGAPAPRTLSLGLKASL